MNTLAGEVCDNSENNSDDADACRTNCTLPVCGDGVVDTGEACDDGGASTCNRLHPCVCGDGVLNSAAGETCDDSNAITEVCDYGQPSCRSVARPVFWKQGPPAFAAMEKWTLFRNLTSNDHGELSVR